MNAFTRIFQVLVLAGLGGWPAWADFVFVQTTDTHVGVDHAPGSNVAKCAAMWEEISRLEPRPAFVINTGDVCEVGIDAEYANYRDALPHLAIPHHDAPGNHDVRWNPRGKEGYTAGVGQPLYQSWDYQGVHFVVLDSTVLLQHWGHFDAAMLRWLKSDLEKTGTERPVILAFHHWVGRDTVQIDNEEAIRDVVAPYNVRLWLIGHGHSDLLWNIDGAPAVMAKGLYQGSYHLIEVSGTRLRVLRRSLSTPTPTEEVVSVPLARPVAPRWSAAVQGGAAEAVVTVRGELPADAVCSFTVDSGPTRSMERAGDAWMARLATADLMAGEHVLRAQAVLPDGRAYVRSLVLTTERPGTPRPAWRVDAGSEVQGKLILAGGTLYVPCMGGDLLALDPATGRERWRFHTGGAVFSTPLIADGTVYFGSADHNVYAVEASSGKPIWKTPTQGAVFAGAARAGGVVCIASTDKTIYGLDAATGVVRWKAQGEGMYQSAAATDGRRFYVGGWDNYFRALGVATGREIWKNKFGRSFAYSPAIGSPTVGDEKVFVTSNDGYLHAMKADTGEVAWEVAGPKLGYSGPLFHDGRIYNASLTDEGFVFRFDAATGQKQWETPTGSVIYDSSCAWGATGAVFVGSVDGTFSALRAADGASLWQYRLGPGHVLASPATDAERVYIGSLSGRVTALPLTAQD
jgi:outer membrane protein assembly factor BamB